MLSSSPPTLGRLRAVFGTCQTSGGTRTISTAGRTALRSHTCGVVCPNFTLAVPVVITCRRGSRWSDFRRIAPVPPCATLSVLKRPPSSSMRLWEAPKGMSCPPRRFGGRVRRATLALTRRSIFWTLDRRPLRQRVQDLELMSCLLAVLGLGAHLCPRRLLAKRPLPVLFAATLRQRATRTPRPWRPSGRP